MVTAFLDRGAKRQSDIFEQINKWRFKGDLALDDQHPPNRARALTVARDEQQGVHLPQRNVLYTLSELWRVLINRQSCPLSGKADTGADIAE
jgi:hypothetical protein